jgi:hypothetical protein
MGVRKWGEGWKREYTGVNGYDYSYHINNLGYDKG